jgi:hypothetical protein
MIELPIREPCDLCVAIRDERWKIIVEGEHTVTLINPRSSGRLARSFPPRARRAYACGDDVRGVVAQNPCSRASTRGR